MAAGVCREVLELQRGLGRISDDTDAVWSKETPGPGPGPGPAEVSFRLWVITFVVVAAVICLSLLLTELEDWLKAPGEFCGFCSLERLALDRNPKAAWWRPLPAGAPKGNWESATTYTVGAVTVMAALDVAPDEDFLNKIEPHLASFWGFPVGAYFLFQRPGWSALLLFSVVPSHNENLLFSNVFDLLTGMSNLEHWFILSNSLVPMSHWLCSSLNAVLGLSVSPT